jgi:hypothetical protein
MAVGEITRTSYFLTGGEISCFVNVGEGAARGRMYEVGNNTMVERADALSHLLDELKSLKTGV